MNNQQIFPGYNEKGPWHVWGFLPGPGNRVMSTIARNRAELRDIYQRYSKFKIWFRKLPS